MKQFKSVYLGKSMYSQKNLRYRTAIFHQVHFIKMKLMFIKNISYMYHTLMMVQPKNKSTVDIFNLLNIQSSV